MLKPYTAKLTLDTTDWLVLGGALLILALSVVLTLYRLSLPSTGRSFFDDPEPGLGYNDGPVLVTVEGVPVEKIIWGAVTFRPQLPANWATGQRVSYSYLGGLESAVTLWPDTFSLDRIDRWHWPALLSLAFQLLLGLYVFFRRPRSPATRLLLLYSVFAVADLITRLVTHGSNEIRLVDYLYRTTYWPTLIFQGLEEAAYALLLHFFLVFPVVKPPLRRYPRLTLALLYGSTLLIGLTWNAGQPFALLVGRFPFFMVSVWFLFIFASLMLSVRHTLLTLSNPIEQAQVRWMTWGVALPGFNLLLLALIFMAGELGLGNSLNHALLEQGVVWLYFFFPFTSLAFPLALTMALLRYRLFDIDILLNRTLVYGALTAIVVVLYGFVVGLLGSWFQAEDLLLSILATGLVAILFQPLRQYLQRGVNRLMYGERDDPATVLTRLGRRLEAVLAPEVVLSTIVETVAQALKLPYTAIALRENGEFKIAAEYPGPDTAVGAQPIEEAGNLSVFNLVYQSESIGQLLVAPRAHGDTFSPADWRLLADLASQASMAVHAVRLTSDLQRSRERLVATREEERRRLRRDLHDGLGPQLASLTLKLDAVRNLLAQGQQPKAETLLLDLKTQTQTAIADIRRLVYNLRPPALDELGLVSALREYAAHNSFNGLQIIVEAPEALLSRVLPAAVETAAYRIALEALTNVTRHAGARHCLIRLTWDNSLRLEIIDDGVGLPAEYRAGIGLSSMRERAAELGGTCTIESLAIGGTRVVALWPGLSKMGEEG